MVTVIEPTLLVPAEPLFVMSTARSIVSPGTRFEADTVSRLADPSVSETVPELRFCACADVELVKLAKVPSPAMPAATPRIAIVASSFAAREVAWWRSLPSIPQCQPTRAPGTPDHASALDIVGTDYDPHTPIKGD